MAPRLAALLALVLVAVAPALAQVPAPQVTVTLDAARLDVGAGNLTLVNATVAYADAVPGQTANVQLVVAAPDGWTATLDKATLALAPGGSDVVQVALQAPAAGQGAATGKVALTANANAGAGRTATATAALDATRVDPLPPPPPDNTPLLLGAAALLLLALVGLGLWMRQRRRARYAAERQAAERAAAERAAYLARETGITLAIAGPPEPFGDRREVAQRFTVQNASDRPRVALVDVAEVPPGWLAAVNVPRRELRPGEAMTITLTTRPPDGAPLGATARIVLAARPEEARELDARVTLDVRAPDARPSPTPPLAHRDGVIPKVLRR